ETRSGVVPGNEEKNDQHHEQLDTDQHHAHAHARFERDVIDRVGLAAKASEGRARVCEGVHANAEPGHAIAAAHADEAQEQNNRHGQENRFARDRRKHAEVEDDDDGDEHPKQKKEFALRDEIGFAGLVNELGDLAHGAVHGQVLEASEDGQAEEQAEDTDENAEE